MTEKPLSPLKDALSRGEALLILGQDHSPELVDQILVDAQKLFASNRAWHSLPELYTIMGSEEAARKALASVFEKQQPSAALLELASLPWMSVITTAVDPVVLQALRGVGSERRIVELGPSSISALSPASSGQLLHLIRAFGTPDAEGPSMTPTSPSGLAEARMIRFPGIVSMLPRLVGLHGHVVIEGVTERDWLDDQTLAALCVTLAMLPSGRVYWFGTASERVRTALAERAHFEERSLQTQLREWVQDEQLRDDLARARNRVFGIGDRVVTLKQGGASIQMQLTGPEWRSISHVCSILDDASLADLRAQKSSGTAELVAYLRRSHAGAPDWSGVARGFVFEREVVTKLISEVRTFVEERKASILESAETAHGRRRVPFLLSGPPASGKTMGLLHTAWTLRSQYQLCVLWLLPGVAGIDIVAIEHVCRMLESKGAKWVVLFLDSTELDEHFRLKRRLEANGRRIVVVGTDSRLRAIDGEENDETTGEICRFHLEHRMTTGEMTVFRSFLSHHVLPLPAATSGSQDFLRLLSAAVPEVQFGALSSLLDEYERILSDVRAAENTRGSETPPPSHFAQQLQISLPDLFSKTGEPEKAFSRYESDTVLRDLINLVLFCAQVDRPITVDLLLKVLGTDLINKYDGFSQSFSDTALIQEIELDYEGTPALTTGHQLHATWLLRILFPDRSAQLGLLRKLAESIDWTPDAYPGDNLHQDFVLELLRAVGPRGDYRNLFNSVPTLERLEQLIGDLRESFNIRQPKLLTLEAIILGDLAQRQSTQSPGKARDYGEKALELLALAEELLRKRRPSDARNFEIQRVLTLASDIRGTLINIRLRNDKVATKDDVKQVFGELSQIEKDAMRAQSYAPSYHPWDIVCWTHKDVFDRLPLSADSASRILLLETIESALEAATEEELDPTQISRYKQRQVELQDRLGKQQVSAQLAREMREQRDFSGELSLARNRLHNAGLHGGGLAVACQKELTLLYGFRPHILQAAHAVRFLHSLWTRVFMDGRLGDGTPKLVKASVEDWRILEDIARSRLRLAEDSELPYAMFFLAWALYQLDEPRGAREVLSSLERQSFGNPRRVGELVYLSNNEGHARVFVAKVVHPRSQQVRLSVPELDGQIMDLRPEVETRVAPTGLRLGEFIDISIALNYRGVQARSPKEYKGHGNKKQ